jgi:hypothetical protein
VLTWCGTVAWHAPVYFGASLSLVLARAASGNATLGMCAWAAAAALGFWWFVSGIHAGLTHADPIRIRSLLWSLLAIGMALRLMWLGSQIAGGPMYHANMQAAALGWLASNGLNVWLQLRGFRLWSRMLKAVRPKPSY